jgi:CRP-like cAMP-binding protein
VTGRPESQANRLLDTLTRAEREDSAGEREMVSLDFGQVLHEARTPIKHVYFPTGCVISLLTHVTGHPAVAVSMVGREGIVGLSVARHVTAAIVQGSGTAVRMTARAYGEHLLSSPTLKKGVLRYVDALFSQITQTAACNTFHPLETRLSRWLMMTRDRSRSAQLELTQEFLAQMLGVRRVGITVAAGNLQRRGIIAYSRGRIAILDEARLASAACECYAVLSPAARSRA